MLKKQTTNKQTKKRDLELGTLRLAGLGGRREEEGGFSGAGLGRQRQGWEAAGRRRFLSTRGSGAAGHPGGCGRAAGSGGGGSGEGLEGGTSSLSTSKGAQHPDSGSPRARPPSQWQG